MGNIWCRKPGLDTALNTWNYDTSVIKFRSHVGWKQDNIWAARLGLTDEAWRLTSLKLQNSERRFPAFWGPGFDWVPDHNWGGSGMIGLQEMLLQTDDKRILLFHHGQKIRMCILNYMLLIILLLRLNERMEK